MRKKSLIIVLVLVCFLAVSLSACFPKSQSISEYADKKVDLANAMTIATGINAHNVMHPDTTIIDESNMNPETVFEVLDEDGLWPDGVPTGDDLKPILELIYFEDGEAKVIED